MLLKAKNKTTAPSKVEAKNKAFRAKKAVLKGIHSHPKENEFIHHPPSKESKHAAKKTAYTYPKKSTLKRNKLDHYDIIKFPLTTESAMKETEYNTQGQ